jgi:anti-anti-sigma factor
LTLAETSDTVLTLTAHGLLDADTVDDLNQALRVIFDHPGLTQLLLDFDPLTSIDSTGIAALVTAHQHAQRSGITLTIVNCGVAVQRTLEVAGLYGPLTHQPVAGQRGQGTAAAPHPRLPGPRQSAHRAPDREHPTPAGAATATNRRN